MRVAELDMANSNHQYGSPDAFHLRFQESTSGHLLRLSMNLLLPVQCLVALALGMIQQVQDTFLHLTETIISVILGVMIAISLARFMMMILCGMVLAVGL